MAGLWRHLSGVLGEPSPVRKIIIQELAAHPEIRQRALELHEQMAALVARYLAQASQHPGEPLPEHEAAARLLTIAAGMAPLLGEPSLTLIPPAALAALISEGLQPRGRPARRGWARRGHAEAASGGREGVMDTPERPPALHPWSPMTSRSCRCAARGTPMRPGVSRLSQTMTSVSTATARRTGTRCS